MKKIYTPDGYDDSYQSILSTLNNVNDLLKKDGVSAPSEGSLECTLQLYKLINRPLDCIPVVHIGGTNGKGSTSYKISKCLSSIGHKTGLFVSPHIFCFRERIQINGILISEDELVEYSKIVLQLCSQHSIGATLFELIFIISCMYYSEMGCDAVVLEVGLGGKYDATNVVQSKVAIICSVSLDHTRILGSSVEEIAEKKSGIFKSKTLCIVGPRCPMQVITKVANENGAILHTLESLYNEAKDTSMWIEFNRINGNNQINDIVDTDVLNSALALSALYLLDVNRILPNATSDSTLINEAVLQRPPCRWERHYYNHTANGISSSCSSGSGSNDICSKVEVIFDVGHNPAAIEALVARVKRELANRNLYMLYGVSRDKDAKQCLKQVLEVVKYDQIFFIQSKNWRAMDTKELNELFFQVTNQVISVTALNTNDDKVATIKETVAHVVQLATSDPNSVVIVCGTGYIMADARAAIGLVDPTD